MTSTLIDFVQGFNPSKVLNAILPRGSPSVMRRVLLWNHRAAAGRGDNRRRAQVDR